MSHYTSHVEREGSSCGIRGGKEVTGGAQPSSNIFWKMKETEGMRELCLLGINQRNRR